MGALALLLVAVCLGVGSLTTLQLRGYLVDRLDAQLAAADTRSTTAGDRSPNADGGGGGGAAGVAAAAPGWTSCAPSSATGSSPTSSPGPGGVTAIMGSTRRNLP